MKTGSVGSLLGASLTHTFIGTRTQKNNKPVEPGTVVS